jgi:hypothetical protein
MKKILLIITMAFTLNANAGGDIFNDVGEWINNNDSSISFSALAKEADIDAICSLVNASPTTITCTGFESISTHNNQRINNYEKNITYDDNGIYAKC